MVVVSYCDDDDDDDGGGGRLMMDLMGRALLGPWVYAMSDSAREVTVSAGR